MHPKATSGSRPHGFLLVTPLTHLCLRYCTPHATPISYSPLRQRLDISARISSPCKNGPLLLSICFMKILIGCLCTLPQNRLVLHLIELTELSSIHVIHFVRSWLSRSVTMRLFILKLSAPREPDLAQRNREVHYANEKV